MVLLTISGDICFFVFYLVAVTSQVTSPWLRVGVEILRITLCRLTAWLIGAEIFLVNVIFECVPMLRQTLPHVSGEFRVALFLSLWNNLWWRGSIALSSPILAVERAVAYSLGDMCGGDVLYALEVGNGACHLYDTVVGTCREI